MGRFTKMLLFFSITLLSVGSCKQDTGMFAGYENLASLESAYQANPNPQSANDLIKSLLETLKEPDLETTKRNSFLDYGYKLAKEEGINSRAASFLFPIIKEDSKDSADPNKIFELAGMMKKLKKTAASNTLYQSIVDNAPNFEKANEAADAITDDYDNIDSYIYNLGEELFKNPDNTGINRTAAMKYVDACEAYALGYPGGANTPAYLFKSAEVAKSLRTYSKSLSLYDWVLEKYPNYEKAPTALFLKGFIIENNVGDDLKAREIYDQFLSTFPDHDLADDVEFLIENLGKSDEEILQMIEAKKKDK